MNIRELLETEVLPFVQRPARYIGGEINATCRPAAEIRFLLSYPDLYEVGMSHHGLRILYDVVNRLSWASAERAFAVWDDMEAELRRKEIPLCSLESFTPAAEFDIWGFSLQVELTYTNILAMLDLAGVPLESRERPWPGYPLILGGGANTTNPEPLADFFDLFLIGDGEEAVVEILGAYRSWKRETADAGSSGRRKKEDLLRHLVEKVPGLYAPSLYEVTYDASGRFRTITPSVPSIPKRVKRRILENIDSSRIERPLVPITEIVHDRAVVEIMRGCRRGCRFCQAGWVGRPVREKDPGMVIRQACDLVEKGGFEEVSLLSLSAGDYRGIEPLLEELSPMLAGKKARLSLPSLNIATVSERMLKELKRLKKSGVTLAPEAGSDRLQGVINKHLDAGLLGDISRKLRELGWRILKLYFMIGLPTETDEDLEAIAALINRTAGWGGQLNVTVSNFVPKPGTPFQWTSMAQPDEIIRKQGLLRRLVHSRKVKLKFHPAVLSRLEGIFARGDRLLGAVLRSAWGEGCRFDGWTEHFSEEKWAAAFRKTGVEREKYLNPPYNFDDPLPWDHIDAGPEKKILVRESRRAFGESIDK